jgi:hypothetical protein
MLIGSATLSHDDAPLKPKRIGLLNVELNLLAVAIM